MTQVVERMPDPDRPGRFVRRCISIAPQHLVQCGKRDTHNQTDILIAHQNGSLIWSGDAKMVSAVQRPSIRAEWEKAAADRMASFTSGPLATRSAALGVEEQLADWWRDRAEDEIGQTVSKAIEYGATDLIDIGMMLARTMRREVSEEEAAELGVFFYLIGKIARWQSAIERGDRPSDDTLLDIGVYVRMAQRIRSAGSWPGVETA